MNPDDELVKIPLWMPRMLERAGITVTRTEHEGPRGSEEVRQYAPRWAASALLAVRLLARGEPTRRNVPTGRMKRAMLRALHRLRRHEEERHALLAAVRLEGIPDAGVCPPLVAHVVQAAIDAPRRVPR